MIVQQIIFILVSIVCFYLAGKRIFEIRRNILSGRDIELKNTGGLKSMLLLALGQKKMFQNLLPAIMHLFIYVAFIITQIELLEIFADGILGTHRLFYNTFGGGFHNFYYFIINFIEILSVLALIATFIFLARRNLLKVPRLVMDEMNGWPKLDANLILLWEIWLVGCIFLMNGADGALHPDKYQFIVSKNFAPLFAGMSDGTLQLLERIGWWGHIAGVLAFLVYIPYSKHLHILFAFPNAWYLEEKPAGSMVNMPTITNEVKAMFDPSFVPPAPDPQVSPQKFGAKDANELSWKNLLDAYSCTECGRCTQQCPANQTGKKLSPRKIMMDTRDRIDEIGKMNLAENEPVSDGKSLLGDYITEEEIRACTTCNACVQACPVSINPLDIILQLRRYQILEESKSPEEWNVMFNNIENNFAPWQFAPTDRAKWVTED